MKFMLMNKLWFDYMAVANLLRKSNVAMSGYLNDYIFKIYLFDFLCYLGVVEQKLISLLSSCNLINNQLIQ